MYHILHLSWLVSQTSPAWYADFKRTKKRRFRRCQVSQVSAESLALLKVELRDFRYEVPGWWLKVEIRKSSPKLTEDGWKLKSGNLPQRYRLSWRGFLLDHLRWVWKKNLVLSLIYLRGGTWKKTGNPEIKECLFDHFWDLVSGNFPTDSFISLLLCSWSWNISMSIWPRTKDI